MEKILGLLMESPEMLEGLIKEMVSKYKPLVYSVLNEIFETYKDLNANDEYFEQQALAKKKLLEAYREVGFTREEAMLFILDGDMQKKNIMKSISSGAKKDQSSSK